MNVLELHRPVTLDRIGSLGLDFAVEATPAECAALADRMSLPAVHALSCTFHLIREGRDKVYARGHLRARVIQTCVVTLDDFEAELEEVFQVRFVPSGEESDDLDPDSDDEIPFEGNAIDLGEAAAEQLGLALDPYPRMPGVALEALEDEAEPHPFSRLAGLKRLN